MKFQAMTILALVLGASAGAQQRENTEAADLLCRNPQAEVTYAIDVGTGGVWVVDPRRRQNVVRLRTLGRRVGTPDCPRCVTLITQGTTRQPKTWMRQPVYTFLVKPAYSSRRLAGGRLDVNLSTPKGRKKWVEGVNLVCEVNDAN